MTTDKTDAPLTTPSHDAGFPHLRRTGGATQLVVDGRPYLALGGELHNSSTSSPEYMAPVWDRLGAAGIRTLISVASWQLVEPEEGVFDFTAVDDQIAQARARGIRLVLLWFGAYKNADSAYAPRWVRSDEDRFPRAERDPEQMLSGRFALDGPILSVFSEELTVADARAFAALMAHIAEIDRDHTVIMVQVENEVGLLGDSRDRSALADAAWEQDVPAALLDGLVRRGASLHPWIRDVWSAAGSRTSGTWSEVFGTDREAEEIFMAWAFSSYVERVASAGTAAHPIPHYANAWLGPQPGAETPGQYPSGGPVSRMLDIWRIGAPTLGLLAPDIYVQDFTGTIDGYASEDNPIFIPEAIPIAGNAFIAVGAYKAIGFNPFGIEDLAVDHEIFRCYRVLEEMRDLITDAQVRDRIHGFSIATGEVHQARIGDYDVTLNGARDTYGLFGTGTGAAADTLSGYGLILQTDDDEFVVAARHASLSFSRTDARVELDELQEGTYTDGVWSPRRTLNGDERYFAFQSDDLRVVRVRLLRRAL
ncbi:DUF5597 domain-containing protein [Microbacterium sp. NPDC089696]|uniref:GH35 family beta-galactosidase n=1 Tax=Microbacterium sp. NPDC089696 TaxID=3364199 RepID=UPI0037FC4BE4